LFFFLKDLKKEFTSYDIHMYNLQLKSVEENLDFNIVFMAVCFSTKCIFLA